MNPEINKSMSFLSNKIDAPPRKIDEQERNLKIYLYLKIILGKK